MIDENDVKHVTKLVSLTGGDVNNKGVSTSKGGSCLIVCDPQKPYFEPLNMPP